jgi:hypothetical protein
MAWPLGDDFDHRRRKVGVGVNRHVVKGDYSGDAKKGHEEKDDGPLAKRELNDAMNH